MSNDPFAIVRGFEMAVSEYTGAPFVISTTSCTMGLLLACAWWRFRHGHCLVSMPRLSYVGVPASILNAGLSVKFHEEDWQGEYRLLGTDIWDSARRFTHGMYRQGQIQVTSHHWAKILPLGQGGCILLDDQIAAATMRKMRFDGRTEGYPANLDQVFYPSWHAIMTPETAAHGLMKLAVLQKYNADLPRSDYPDLSRLEAFK